MPEALGIFTERDTERVAAAVRHVESTRGGNIPPLQEQQPHHDQHRIPFRNDSGATIPGWGLMRVTGVATVDGRRIRTVAKPDGTYRWKYLVNSRNEVAADKRGWGTWLWDGDDVLYDTGATPAYGEEWGPKNDSWLVWQHRPGFWIEGGTTGSGSEARVLAMQIIPAEILVKNDSGNPYAAGSGPSSYEVWGGAQGSEADTGLTISAYNKMSIEFGDGKFGSVGRLNGKNYVVTWQT